MLSLQNEGELMELLLIFIRETGMVKNTDDMNGIIVAKVIKIEEG
jgi:hypothetical protein